MKKGIYWTPRIIAAVIMLQTLFFKFTAAPESVYIFSTLGVEPYGRIGAGVMELIASVLLLIPRFSVYGAILTLGVMGGAILSHLAFLGIEVQEDGGQLFVMAVIVALCAAYIAFQEKETLFALLKKK